MFHIIITEVILEESGVAWHTNKKFRTRIEYSIGTSIQKHKNPDNTAKKFSTVNKT